MSLFGAMNTAVSGLTAQSAAFANISDNVANSQTTGYKGVDTNFVDYLTSSDAQENVPGSVIATPGYENNVQGTISQSSDPLALAISGQGFFAVSEQSGTVNNQPTFNAQQFYTRAGDFQLDDNGYLVNSAGEFLNGWAVSNGVADQNSLAPIQVSQTVFNPIATDNIDLSANLPATPAAGTGVPAIYNQAGAAVVDGNISANMAAALGGPYNGTTGASAYAAALLDEGAANDANTAFQANTNLTAGDIITAMAADTGANAYTIAVAAANAPGATAASVVTAVLNASASSSSIACVACGVPVPAPTALTPPTATTPGDYTLSEPISSQINVYDGLGTAHTVTLNWVQNSANNWTVQVNVPDDQTVADPSAVPPLIAGADRGSADVTFGTGAAAGTVANVLTDANDPGNITTNPNVSGTSTAATLSFTCDFGSGNQTITLNLGNYGKATGLTQYAGTTYDLRGLSQNGVPPGAFSSVTTSTNGDVSVNYDNGQSRVVAQVPVITFNAPDQLQRQDAQAFTVSQNSGAPLAEEASTNGAGALVTQSVEGSNVDIATEFTKLIVAQQAYSANAKMVTTAQEMLTTTVDMKQ